MKKLYFPFLVAFSLIITACNTAEDTISFDAMNTFMTVRSFGGKSVKANLAVKERIVQLENTISTTKETSEIWKINHSDGMEIQISEDTKALAEFSLNMAARTNGALNPCLYPVIREWGFTTGEYKVPDGGVISALLQNTNYTKVVMHQKDSESFLKLDPEMMIDFGAVGKGYAGDEAIKVLSSFGIKSALLDLGGNIQALGSKTDGNAWTIGIKNPFENKSGPVASVKIRDKAVITSGGYERYFVDQNDNHKYIHIFDGKTGAPVENNIASVTIIADSGLYGDALSTSLVVLGVEESINFWKQYKDFDFIFITQASDIYYTSGLKESLNLIYDFKTVTVIE